MVRGACRLGGLLLWAELPVAARVAAALADSSISGVTVLTRGPRRRTGGGGGEEEAGGREEPMPMSASAFVVGACAVRFRTRLIFGAVLLLTLPPALGGVILRFAPGLILLGGLVFAAGLSFTFGSAAEAADEDVVSD